MRIRPLLAVAAAFATGCGQTGSLYLPDQSVESPVEIRTTPPAPPPASEQAPKPPSDKDDKKDDEPAVPPDR